SGVMVQIYHGNAFTQRKNPVLRPLKPVGSAGFSWGLPGSPRFFSVDVLPPNTRVPLRQAGSSSVTFRGRQSSEDDAITPPKLMPPFQRTAARGMFPTEHTNEMTATSGPTIGPQK